MRWVLVLVVRFCQFIGILAVLTAATFLEPLFEKIADGWAGQPWDWGEIARLTACITGPTFLGLLMIVGLGALLSFDKQSEAGERAFPDEPWMWRPMWAAKHIRLSNRGGWIFLAIAWLFYLAVALPMGLAMAAIKLSTPIYVFLGAFALILFAITRISWINRKWNRSELKLGTLPGIIGGPFSGVVVLAEHFPQGTPFRVTLQCELMRSSTGRSGGGSHSHTETLWQQQRVVDRSIDAGRPDAIALPVYFAIPFDSEPTGFDTIRRGAWYAPGPRVRRTVRWWLSITPKDETDVRNAKFEVPVFKTAASSPDYREDESLVEPYLEKPAAESVLATIPHRIESIPGGRRICFHVCQWQACVFLVGLGAASAYGLWAAIWYARPLPLTAIAALLPGALLVIAVSSLFEMLFWGSRLDVYEDRVEASAGFTGYKRTVSWQRGRMPGLECVEDFRKASGSWWRIQVDVGAAGKATLVKRLDGRQDAESVRAWLQEQL